MRVYTLKFPLEVVSKQETFDTLDEDSITEVVKFNLKSTILTSPGERRSDPQFGVGARSYLFSQDTELIEELREDIIQQASRYVPYCILDEVTINQDEEYQDRINILIKFTIPQINKRDIFELSISEL